MLGEDHSLANDFPELEGKINELMASDPSFEKANKHYIALDKEIRKLEMRRAPIEDEEMTRLKYERAQLKDNLYAQLTDHQVE